MKGMWQKALFGTALGMVILGMVLSQIWLERVGVLLLVSLAWQAVFQKGKIMATTRTGEEWKGVVRVIQELVIEIQKQETHGHKDLSDFFEEGERLLLADDVVGYLEYLSKIKKKFEEDNQRELEKKREKHQAFQKAFYKLPYLRILLLNVIEKTEEATNRLIESFLSVSEKNRQALEEVKKRLLEQDGESMEKILTRASEITQSYQLMQKQQESMMASNEAKMEEFGRQTQKMFSQLRAIDEILSQNKVIAVNLSIEGVKFGEKGRAIKVIVNEIQKLNQKIDHFTEEVSHRLEQFEAFNQELWNTWVHQMSLSLQEFQKASENAVTLIERLDRVSRYMSDVSHLLQENATAVQKDLDTIVESLQFQDITRQQIENVMSYLGQIQDDIKKGSVALVQYGLSLDEWDMEKMDEAKMEMIQEAKVSSERFLLK